MNEQIRPGDIMVSRCNGTRDAYLISEITSGPPGRGHTLNPDSISLIFGQNFAVQMAYRRQTGDQKVWLFDGTAASDESYVEAPRPTVPIP